MALIGNDIFKLACELNVGEDITRAYRSMTIDEYGKNNGIDSSIERELRVLITKWFIDKYQITPAEYFKKWTQDVKKYCFQGGYGYHFDYNGCPDHWCVKPEYIQDFKQYPEGLFYACSIANVSFSLWDKPQMEKWGN